MHRPDAMRAAVMESLAFIPPREGRVARRASIDALPLRCLSAERAASGVGRPHPTGSRCSPVTLP
jgi:hypothetical protein